MPLDIVYLEDQPDAVENITEYLRSWGHSVFQAATVTDALEFFRQQTPDLLLLDIMMKHGKELDAAVPPRHTGLEILRMIRQGQAIGDINISPDLPVIVITAVGNLFDLSLIRNMGVEEVFEKPISAELDLQPCIERFESRRAT